MRVLSAILIVAATVLLREAAPPGSTLSPAQTLELVRSTTPPVRDLADLRSRIENPSALSVQAQAGTDAFWINDLVRRTYRLVQVEPRHSSEHAEWYVETGREAANLIAAADFFEAHTFPRVQELTGVGWTPGSDGQPRLAIYNGQTPGVAGYMSSNDAEPRSVHPYSNERLIVYMNLDLRPGSNGYNATLAHELEHLAHSVVNPYQQGWVDEGLAELVSNLVMGASSPSLSSFRSRPDIQLSAWSDTPSETRPHYEASYLWARYLMERGGGPASLPDLVRAGGQGFATAERFARLRGIGGGAEGLFRDWIVANVLGNPVLEDGRFGYQGLDQNAVVRSIPSLNEQSVDEQVHQFGADYYEAVSDAGTTELNIEVMPTVPLIGATDVRGSIFWSLRGDNLDTRLTRAFDLSGVGSATLRFGLWHEIEQDYDFCYALASRDGAAWVPLRGRWTTERDNVGPGVGPGYTGRSSGYPSWVQDEMDLSAFAGGQVQVRFECVTDQGFSASGLAIDDISIPEIGFIDDAESDQGWSFDGFVRAPNSMQQPALVLVLEVTDQAVGMREIRLDAAGRGRLPLDSTFGPPARRIVVIAGTAPVTLQEMSYKLWVAAPD